MLRRGLAIALALSLLLPFAAAAEESGVNRTIELEGTPIAEITAPEISTDGVEFNLGLRLVEAAQENGTTVEWTVQMCRNSGVCDPPVRTALSEDDAGLWTATVTPPEEHSYVNYDIVLTYPDGDESERFPEKGFSKGGKVWSDCWVSGEDSGGDNCPEPIVEGDGGMLPAPGAFLAVTAGLGAALIATRD